MKACPDCAESVQEDARVCKHCGYAFSGRRPDRESTLIPAWVSMVVIGGLILAAVVLALAVA